MPTTNLQRGMTHFEFHRYDTKLYLMVCFQSWNLGIVEYPFHCHYSGRNGNEGVLLIHFDPDWLFWFGFYFADLIECLNHLLRIIIICYLKPYSSVQITYITYIYIYMKVPVHIHTHTHSCNIDVYRHFHIYIYIYIYIYGSACIHTYIYIYIYICKFH